MLTGLVVEATYLPPHTKHKLPRRIGKRYFMGLKTNKSLDDMVCIGKGDFFFFLIDGMGNIEMYNDQILCLLCCDLNHCGA